jgi:predicted permease
VRTRVDQLAATLQTAYPSTDAGWTMTVVPLHAGVVGRLAPALRLMLAATMLVLLVACASVANLLLVRAVARRSEFAIRVAVGATRAQLFRQVLTESALVSVAGGLAGLALAASFVPMLTGLGFARFTEIRIDAAVLGFTMIAAALATLLSSTGPALVIARGNVAPLLAASGSRAGSGSARAASRAIVVMQIAISVALAVGAALLAVSLRNLVLVDPGFRATGMITARVAFPRPRYRGSDDFRRFERELLARVTALPGVAGAGVVNTLPLGGRDVPFSVHVEDRPADTHAALFSAEMRAASPGYFAVMGIPLVAGRLLEERDVAGSAEVLVVSRTMAGRLWPGIDAVGRRVSLDGPGGPWLTVVGVVGDVRHAGLAAEPAPTMYRPYAQEPWPSLTLVIRAGSRANALSQPIRRVIGALDPELAVYDVRLMDDFVAGALALPRLQGVLMAAFAMLALVLALAGVYGVMSHAVARRAPEIALRLALGGDRRSVVSLIMRQGGAMVGAGVAVGLGSAWALTQLLSGALFGVGSRDPVVFAATAAAVAATAMLACYLPARSAAGIDPIRALRRA